MIQPLTVVYLHTPSEEDATLLQDMEYGLSDAFRVFCREVFAYDAPFDFPRLKLVTAATPKELDAILFGVENERHFVADAAKFCCLFLFDDEILLPGDETPTPLDKLTLDGLNIFRWFLTYFPALPKVLLTVDGHKKIDIPSRRWIAKHRYVLEHPAQHQARIRRMFSFFWSPHFAGALQEYRKSKTPASAI